MKSFAIWNNKGGVGKTYLTFAIASEYAYRHPDERVIVADMCPQANLSEIVLGGNGQGAATLGSLISQRKTIGGYFDKRTRSAHEITGSESSYLLKASDFNKNMPDNFYILAGDPSLEIQAPVINQLSAVALPAESWRNVHLWLRDLIVACAQYLGMDEAVCFIDCNPSFAAYTELSLLAADQLIVPCSSDGSSARAVDNLGQLIYGIDVHESYKSVSFSAMCSRFGIRMPLIHSFVFNRSTQYDKRASKAFSAMFNSIEERAQGLRKKMPSAFRGGKFQCYEVPDNHSVAIVSSHHGMPLHDLKPGSYKVYDTKPQVNNEPIDRYKKAIETLVSSL